MDAVIITQEGLIPVDAKFPLENYRRFLRETDPGRKAEHERAFANDVKARTDETAKYVRPPETLPFAFMFVPAEGIYYDLLVNEVGTSDTRHLVDDAQKKKVIMVSPTTFTAYLYSVLYGFKAFKIERDALEIRKNVDNLSRHLSAYDEFFKRLGASLSTTVNHYNTALRELGKIDRDVVKIGGNSINLESQQVDRPQLAAD